MEQISLTNGSLGLALNCNDSSGTSTRVALSTIGPDGDSIVVTNCGDSIGFLAIGDSTVVAVAPGTTASYPILVNSKEDQIIIKITDAFRRDPWVAGVCMSGESTILVIHRVSR